MSLRVMRKMQAGKELDSLGGDNDLQSDKSADDDLQDNVKIVNNRFNLLEYSHSESEVKEDDDLTEVGEGRVNGDEDILCSSPPQNNTGARKKRRRKKKKGRSKLPASSEDQMDLEEVDEVEMSVREVNAILGEVEQSECIKPADDKPVRNLLAIEYKHLNPQNEMKRIFGSRVVQSAESNRRRGPRRPGTRGGNIIQAHPSLLTTPKSGLSMVMVDPTPPQQVFKFQHSPIYQQAQFRFLEAVESHNPENIIYLLDVEPKHVDTLLQVSEIFRIGDDSAMATKLIEKAIALMEASAHPLFNIATGNCRLNYKQQENRSFFILLFHHILNVSQKGCYRTALELCKLLFSLSPEDDPLAVSLMLDFYALRSQEYAWLVALFDLYEPTKNLSMLPNFSFSVPLALYHMSEQEPSFIGKDKIDRNCKYVQPEEFGTPEELRKRADDMIQLALLRFPGVLLPLLEKCNIQPDEAVVASTFFGIDAQNSMKKGLLQITNLYVGRSYHVWKEAGVMSWLEENVKIVLDRVSKKDPLVKELEEFRKTNYMGTPTAIFRHIHMSEIKDATAALPPTLANAPVMSYDPLPPPDSICDYSRPPPKDKSNTNSSNVLETFFRSLMPNYNSDDPERELDAQAALGEAEAVMGEAAGGELRASVNTLLQAMRQLLSDINVPEPTGADDADQSEEEPDAADWE